MCDLVASPPSPVSANGACDADLALRAEARPPPTTLLPSPTPPPPTVASPHLVVGPRIFPARTLRATLRRALACPPPPSPPPRPPRVRPPPHTGPGRVRGPARAAGPPGVHCVPGRSQERAAAALPPPVLLHRVLRRPGGPGTAVLPRVPRGGGQLPGRVCVKACGGSGAYSLGLIFFVWRGRGRAGGLSGVFISCALSMVSFWRVYPNGCMQWRTVLALEQLGGGLGCGKHCLPAAHPIERGPRSPSGARTGSPPVRCSQPAQAPAVLCRFLCIE